MIMIYRNSIKYCLMKLEIMFLTYGHLNFCKAWCLNWVAYWYQRLLRFNLEHYISNTWLHYLRIKRRCWRFSGVNDATLSCVSCVWSLQIFYKYNEMSEKWSWSWVMLPSSKHYYTAWIFTHLDHLRQVPDTRA